MSRTPYSPFVEKATALWRRHEWINEVHDPTHAFSLFRSHVEQRKVCCPQKGLVLDDVGYTEPENVETRIWRPSLPVIHLASALQLMLHLADPVTGPIGLEALLLGRNVIELLIRTAEYHEALIAQSRHLRIAPERLIRFRLA